MKCIRCKKDFKPRKEEQICSRCEYEQRKADYKGYKGYKGYKK